MADSPELVARLVDLGADPSRAELVGSGVDVERFAPPSPEERVALKAQLGLEPGPVVLSPRKVAPLYNVDTIVHAFARVSSSDVPDVQLVVKHLESGPPPLPDVPGTSRVHVVGHVPYERLADYYRAADVCVSIPSSDSAPRSVWEAMACGAPTVVSNLPWVRESLREGEALVVPITAEAVAEAIGSVLHDPAVAKRLAQAGRAAVVERQDQHAHMDRIAGLYDRLMAERGAP